MKNCNFEKQQTRINTLFPQERSNHIQVKFHAVKET